MKFKLKESIDESLNEDWRDGKFTEDDFNKYVDKTMDYINHILTSISFMKRKHPEYAELFDNLVSEIVDKFQGVILLKEDLDGEIAAMRDKQAELEARRKSRKERFALMHKLFDDKMNADPDAIWIDKVYDIFNTAESVTFVGNKYGTIPRRTEDEQPIRYRYSIEEYDFYSDPYWEIIYVGTNNDDSLKEDLDTSKNNSEVLVQDILDEVSKLLPSEVKIEHNGPTTNRGLTFDLFKIEGPTGSTTGTCVYLEDGEYDVSLTNSSEGKFPDAKSIARFFADHYSIRM